MSICCGEVRAVNDEREPRERGIAREALGDELLEGASALRIRVGMAGAGGVEADGAVALLDAGDVSGLDEEDLRLRIEKPADEPAGRRAIDVNAFARDPFHRWSSMSRPCEGRNSAAQSVPRTPRAAATTNVSDGRIVQSAPPIAAAPATANPRIE